MDAPVHCNQSKLHTLKPHHITIYNVNSSHFLLNIDIFCIESIYASVFRKGQCILLYILLNFILMNNEFGSFFEVSKSINL